VFTVKGKPSTATRQQRKAKLIR